MRVCLLITYTIPADLNRQIESGAAPRMEFFELARLFDAEIIDYGNVDLSTSLPVRIARRIGKPFGLAMLAWKRRRDVDLFYAGSEMTGLLVAAMFRFLKQRPKLAILSHFLSNPKKAALYQLLGLGQSIDALICMNEFQAEYLERQLHVPSEKVRRVQYGANVDGCFFSNKKGMMGERKYILSVGRERRDYATLAKAVDGLEGVRVRIAASGIRDPYEYRDRYLDQKDLPSNIELVDWIPYPQLRDLYAGCAFLVLPMQDVGYPAGITAIMEAMAMGKTVVATYSRGIREFIREGETGFWVDANDAEGLRTRILSLWENPDLAREMALKARESVAERVNLDRYVEELGSTLRSCWTQNA